jgi:hypothetical protein
VRFQSGVESSRIVMSIKESAGSKGESGIQSNRDPHQEYPAFDRQQGAKQATGIGVMLRTIYAIAAAAIVAGTFVTALSIADQVDARGSAPGAKADRADARPLAGSCSQNAWPYFEASCLRDTRNTFGQAHDARLVSTDRLPTATVTAAR